MLFSYRFFIRTTETKPTNESATIIGMRESGAWVVVGRGVGTVVGGRVVTGVVVRTVVGAVVGAVTVNVFTPI